jgi:hypothetical protein
VKGNARAKPSNRLIFGKPLSVGILSGALKAQKKYWVFLIKITFLALAHLTNDAGAKKKHWPFLDLFFKLNTLEKLS